MVDRWLDSFENYLEKGGSFSRLRTLLQDGNSTGVSGGYKNVRYDGTYEPLPRGASERDQIQWEDRKQIPIMIQRALEQFYQEDKMAEAEMLVRMTRVKWPQELLDLHVADLIKSITDLDGSSEDELGRLVGKLQWLCSSADQPPKADIYALSLLFLNLANSNGISAVRLLFDPITLDRDNLLLAAQDTQLFESAVVANDDDLARLLVDAGYPVAEDDRRGIPLISTAIRRDAFDVLQILIDQGCIHDMGENDFGSPIHLAAGKRDLSDSTFNILLTDNRIEPFLTIPDRNHMTPLALLVADDNENRAIRMLRAYPEAVAESSVLDTPLQLSPTRLELPTKAFALAVAYGMTGLVRELIRYQKVRRDINTPVDPRHNYRILHYAVRFGQSTPKLIDLLLTNGAEDVPDIHGKTARSYLKSEFLHFQGRTDVEALRYLQVVISLLNVFRAHQLRKSHPTPYTLLTRRK